MSTFEEFGWVKNRDDKAGCVQSFKFIRSMLELGWNRGKILRAIRKKRYYESFYGSNDRNVIKDILSVRKKLLNVFHTKNDVEEIKASDIDLPDEVLEMAKRFEELQHHMLSEHVMTALKTMTKLFLQDSKVILDFPCGTGKSTGALIISATYASRSNRIWLVTEKIETVDEYARILQGLKAKAVAWHGRPDNCPIPIKEFHNSGGSFCRKCANQCKAIGKMIAEDKWDDDEADILVTTHKHWHASLEAGKIPETVRHVIIDEAPSMMEFKSIDEAGLAGLKDVLRHDHALQKEFESDISKLETILSNGDCKKIQTYDLYAVSNEEKVVQYLRINLGKGRITFEEVCEMYEFLNFMKSETVYAMIDYRYPKDMRGKTLHFGRGNVNINVRTSYMVLDGSARLSDTNWTGFKIYQCPELVLHYPKTRIYTVRANPSKKNLGDEEIFRKLENAVLDMVKRSSVEKEIILFSNKEFKNYENIQKNIERLAEKLRSAGVKLVEMRRGEHYGSNKGRRCTMNAICMSMFLPLPYYVLRTALSKLQKNLEGENISAGRIWSSSKKPFDSPAMKRNGGYKDEEIHLTYLRTIASDIYQTIMRGCIRDNSWNPYFVVCMISNMEIVFFLKKYLIRSDIVFPESGIVESIEKGETVAEILLKFPDKSRAEIESIAKIYENS